MAGETVIIRSYQDILNLLARDGILHQADPPDLSVRIPTARGAVEGLMLLRWQERDGVMQLIHPLPLRARADRLSEVEGAILRLNHALALPGFGLDHGSGQLYYRATLPVVPDGVTDRTVQSVFRAVVRSVYDLLPALRRVVEEGASAEGVVADASVDLALGASPAQN